MKYTISGTLQRTRPLLLGGAMLLAGTAGAQVLFNEQFTGGASTTGFTVQNLGGDCEWVYAPGALDPNNFNQDFGGAIPSGGGFDDDFVFIDSDECGGTAVTVNTTLTSAPFDASQPGTYILRFSHQFEARLESFARVEAYDGFEWSTVVNWTGENVGYPNPAATAVFDITAACNGASNAQVRFQFSSGWDWWWALDNISVTRQTCAFPADLVVSDITQTGATVSWTDNGAPSYNWVITTGGFPDGNNEVASGDGSNTTVTGLLPGNAYTAYVQADCGDLTTSGFGPGTPFVTQIDNDDCGNATVLTVNPDDQCGTVSHGTVMGATDSGVTTDCFGSPDDDVWFSFVATGTSQLVSLLNVSGSATDMYHAVWAGDCGSLTLVDGSCNDGDEGVVSGLTIGTTYYVQVYTYTDEPGQTSQFDVCIGTPPPPPANDECDGAFLLTVNPDLSCDAITHGTVASATNSGITTDCFGTPDDDVWFRFTATNATQYISLLNVQGSTTDLYHALWAGHCGTLTLVDGSCSDGDLSTATGLTVGATYYVQVYSYTDQAGQNTEFDVCIGTPPPPPANDECDGALAVTVNADLACASVTHGTVAGATDSGVTTDCYGSPDDDVWFSFVATNPTHYISLLNSEGSDLDLYHAVWSGDCGSLTLMSGSCSDGDLSSVSGLTIGNTYYVQVYTYTDISGQSTEFDVCVGTPPPPPANDECDGAVALTVNPDDQCVSITAGSVENATGSGLTTTCYGSPDDDVWFSFVATNTAHYVDLLNSDGSDLDLYHALWTGDCNSLTLVDGSCSDGDDSYVAGLTVGTTYYVQVYTYTSTPGQNTTFDVCVGTPPPPPANDECDGAVALTVNLDLECGNVTAGTVASATDSGAQTTCDGTADDDVWFSFVANATTQTISLNDITGSTSDMYMAVWRGTCNNLTLVAGSCSDPEEETVSGLIVGTTYYVQVYTWTDEPGQTSAFNICVGRTPVVDCLGVLGGPALPGTPCINTQFNVGGIWTNTCLCQPNVGVDEVAASELHVSPNPASTELYVSLDNTNAVNVRVYDVVGHVVLERALAKRLDVSTLNAGTYVLVALDAKGEAVARTRFVKH